jgi:hypothetical protein
LRAEPPFIRPKQSWINELHVTDIETLDQAVLDLEDVDHELVDQEIALTIAHDLMNFDDDFPFPRGQDLEQLGK